MDTMQVLVIAIIVFLLIVGPSAVLAMKLPPERKVLVVGLTITMDVIIAAILVWVFLL